MPEKLQLKAGHYVDVSDTDYDHLDAVRSSLLLKFRKSAAHAREEMDRPSESTGPMVRGSALHRLVLEPDTFLKHFVRTPSQTKKTKVDQDAWAAVQAAHPHCRLLRPSEWDGIHLMRDQLLKHPIAKDLLGGDGFNEVTLVWQDPETGLWCKARPDRMIQHYRNVWDDRVGPALLNLKTAHDATPHEFSRAIHSFGYDIQAAQYLAGASVLSGDDGPTRQYVFVVVENEPPYCPVVYQLEDAGLERGQRLWRRYLNLYADAIKHDQWPGYPERVSLIGPPAWAYKREGVESE